MTPEGTYVAFHASREKEPHASGAECYRQLQDWTAHSDEELWLVSEQDKSAARANAGLREVLRATVVNRLRHSRHLLLIVGGTTAEDTDWIPFEIAFAVDECRIPIIASYLVTTQPIIRPFADTDLASYWPPALRARIEDGSAGVIHIPFQPKPVRAAMTRFDRTHFPKGGGLGWISEDAYRSWGMI